MSKERIPNRRMILEVIAEELEVDLQTSEGAKAVKEELKELMKLME